MDNVTIDFTRCVDHRIQLKNAKTGRVRHPLRLLVSKLWLYGNPDADVQ